MDQVQVVYFRGELVQLVNTLVGESYSPNFDALCECGNVHTLAPVPYRDVFCPDGQWHPAVWSDAQKAFVPDWSVVSTDPNKDFEDVDLSGSRILRI